MKSKLVLVALIALLPFSNARAEKVLWQIGKADRDNAEFALAPRAYERFREDGFFIIGSSDPQKDWPYVHPGPDDAWGGAKSHTFTIFFGLQGAPGNGTCRLILDLLDTQSHLPPNLLIEVNGKSFERALSQGAGDGSIFGKPKQGTPQHVVVEFSSALLKPGNNQVNITSTSGSWMLYDCVSLATPDVVETAAVGHLDVLRALDASPAPIERQGKKFQRLAGSLLHMDVPMEAIIRLDDTELQRVSLKTGENSFEAFLPPVSTARDATLSIVAGNRTLASRNVSLQPPLEEIIVVFKTHFDIGYTEMASNVVARYRTTMIDKALEVADGNRHLPAAQQFVWTIPGWPMKRILDDWPGQTPLRKERLENAFKEGRFVVHALPFSTHTELLEIEDVVRGMGFSTRLTRGLGLDRPRDAKMTDVPEHTWALSTLLKHAGVDFMMIGCNGASGPLHVPRLFWWEGPDGSRTLTMYSGDYGTHLIPPKTWTYKTWLAVLHTGDNHGPPRPEEVKQVFDEAATRLPGVKIRIGRMSDFADAIFAEKPNLPVIRGDAPDTWIHGPMSDPAGAKIARNTRPLIPVTEGLNTQLRLWNIDISNAAPTIAAAYEQSLLYGEHTWGGAIGWIDTRLTFGDEFKKDRANGRFNRIEGSWAEHTTYIETMQKLIAPELGNNLRALAKNVNVSGKRIVVYNPLPWKRGGMVKLPSDVGTMAALKSVDGAKTFPIARSGGETYFIAPEIPAMGYRTFVQVKAEALASPFNVDEKSATLETPFFKSQFDSARGTIRSLIDKHSNRELVDTSSEFGLGQYLYERFDNDQVMKFANDYLRWRAADFFKPGLPDAKQVPYRAVSPKNLSLRFEQTAVSVAAIFDAAATTNLPSTTTKIIFYADQPFADLEITLHDKPFEPWPEAGWLCLPFKVDAPQFRLGRLASIVDPTRDVITGANRHIFGLNSGATLTDSAGAGVGFCAIDSPLVSLDTPGCWKYSLDFLPKKPVAFVNLFNNQWNTNFRLWNSGTWTSRVRLWAIDKYQAEAALITPSFEARVPLQVAVAENAAGKLPPTSQGVEVTRKGVLLTAFGSNPDGGAGTLLRVWDYAGNTGDCEIRLPESLNAKSVQPIDLRGRPVGSSIPVDRHSFVLKLGAFAPASVLIETETKQASR